MRARPATTRSAKIDKKFPIGSCHYAPNINYQKNFKFWSTEEIPLEKRLAVKEIKEFIDPDILGFKRKVWTADLTKVGKKKPENCTVEEEIVKVSTLAEVFWD